MKTTAHIIAHTHWDREWYRPFEHHRHDFVVLMNQLLAQFEQDPSFASNYVKDAVARYHLNLVEKNLYSLLSY